MINQKKKVKMKMKVAAGESLVPQSKKYSELDRIFEIQRIEKNAAERLQSFWRKVLRKRNFQYMTMYINMVKRVQRIMRGVLTRKWVAEWYSVRNKIVTTWQAHTRKFVSNLHIRPKLEMERLMAIKIQRIVRGKLARLYARNKLENMSVIRIQCMWRGAIGRAIADKLWLYPIVMPIQKFGRKLLAVKRFKKEFTSRNNAANMIQRRYRSWMSSRKLSNALEKRELDYRMTMIQVLSKEEEFCNEKLLKLMNRMKKFGIKEKAEKSLMKLIKCQKLIFKKEEDLIEIRRQIEICTPRARAQGWVTELSNNEIQIRDQLTKLKCDFLFNFSLEVNNNDDLLEEKVREIEFWSEQRDRVSDYRNLEYEERRHLTYQKEISDRRKEKRMAVGEEKRKWRVLYFSRDGKPDKKRRPGQPWDPSVFAGPEKAVHNIGSHGVDLFAHNVKDGDELLKLGTQESAQRNLDKVSLQSYLEEVNCYEQLLQPLTDIMQKSMKSPQKVGWGPQGGEQLRPAMEQIGAIPRSDWPRNSMDTARSVISDISGNFNINNTLLPKQQKKDNKSNTITFSSSSNNNNNNNNNSRNSRSSSSYKDSNRYKSILSGTDSLLSKKLTLQPINNLEQQLIPIQDVVVLEVINRELQEREDRRKVKYEERRSIKKSRRRIGIIPWELLDKLDGEKKRFENDKLYHEFHHKY